MLSGTLDEASYPIRAHPGNVQERIENEAFFAAATRTSGPAAIPEDVFYAGRPRPAPETSVALRAAATPLRLGILLFLVGWSGILFQASFLQQVVFGAPVFEELAKFGAPLVLAAALGLRALWLRLPLAWASGASFGILEHYVSYVEEDVYTFAGRVVFHAASTGVSMLVYQALEHAPDVRARWAATVPATLFHWANNFGALAFGVASLAFPPIASVAIGWGALVTSSLLLFTLVAIARRRAFERVAQEALAHAMPRLALARQP